jgi:hypothetical protein
MEGSGCGLCGICLKGLEKITKILSHDNRSRRRDSNP